MLGVSFYICVLAGVVRTGAGPSPVIGLPPFLFLIKKHSISSGESLLLSVISIWRGHGRGAISFSCFPSVSASVSVLFLVCPGGARNQVCADGGADGKGQGEGRQKPFVICNSGSTKRRSGKNFLVVKGCVRVWVWVGSLLCLDLGCRGNRDASFLSLSRGMVFCWYHTGARRSDYLRCMRFLLAGTVIWSIRLGTRCFVCPLLRQS